jgi:hypothetical protein
MGVFLFTVLPAIVTLLGYFVPDIEYPLKLIVPLIIVTIYFLILAVILKFQLLKVHSEISSLNTRVEKENKEKEHLNNKLRNYDEFVHKRKLFINYDLEEIGSLVTEYEGHVKNTYRGQRNQEVRVEAGSVKRRTLEIINKEKRDFNEQIFNVQSDTDN